MVEKEIIEYLMGKDGWTVDVGNNIKQMNEN